MGQIVRRKKKGRPSKADLARRSGESPASSQPDLRRSRRRRNVRYNNMIDYDDYLDEEEEDDEDEDERRREKKKLKLVMKLNQGAEDEEEDDEDDGENNNNESVPTRVRSRSVHAPDEDKAVRMKGITGGGNEEMEEDVEEGEEELEEEVEGNEDAEELEHEEEGEEDQSEVSDEKFHENGAMKQGVWWRKRNEYSVHLS